MHPYPWEEDQIPDQFQALIRQREELKQRRIELVNQLNELIAELEGRPVQKTAIGFPYSVIVRFVSKALDTVEMFVRRTVAAFTR
jgi:hypothetical protein